LPDDLAGDIYFLHLALGVAGHQEPAAGKRFHAVAVVRLHADRSQHLAGERFQLDERAFQSYTDDVAIAQPLRTVDSAAHHRMLVIDLFAVARHFHDTRVAGDEGVAVGQAFAGDRVVNGLFPEDGSL